MISNIAELGLLGLANAYRQGDVSAETAVTWYLDRIAIQNPSLNAYLEVFDKSALELARAADARRARGQALSPLDGVPIALKDNIAVAGTRCTNGVGALRDRLAAQTAFAAMRLDDLGCIVLGKLNMDEAALGAATDNPHFGRTDNPFIAGDTPGGSSGGSGAAVAAGLCAAALGTDTLGSVRIPAAYCHVVGLLGSRGMVSRTGVHPLSHSLDQVGVLARNVADSAALYAALCAYDPTDEQSLPSSDRFGQTLNDAIGDSSDMRLRLGFLDIVQCCDGDNAHAIMQRYDELASRLASSGQRIERRIKPALDYTALRRACLLVIEAEGYQACQYWLDRDGVSESLQGMLNYGAKQPASRIEAARATLRDARLQWRALVDSYDLLLVPTAPQTSFAAGSDVPASQADFTTPASVAGLPAISLPAGTAPDGRALSLQLIAPARAESRLLRFANQIQEQIQS
jgi:aspartyl-tRNA(Asn)/glutamyl-tRNA(Gln) amidotransferase subunit A